MSPEIGRGICSLLGRCGLDRTHQKSALALRHVLACAVRCNAPRTLNALLAHLFSGSRSTTWDEDTSTCTFQPYAITITQVSSACMRNLTHDGLMETQLGRQRPKAAPDVPALPTNKSCQAPCRSRSSRRRFVAFFANREASAPQRRTPGRACTTWHVLVLPSRGQRSPS